MTAEFAVGAETEARDSWVPMITIALGQVLMSFNVASLPVALSGMVTSFNVPPTTVATGIVMYSLAVAGFVMLGAKLNQRFGALRVFRGVVVLFGIAQMLMTFSPTANLMLTAQLLSGLAGAALVPSLVALIAENYRGLQQATALGALGSARAGAGVAAFVIGGVLGTLVGWRPAFGILIVLSAVVFFLSFRLKPDHGRPDVAIDIAGVVLAAAAIILISFGFNNLNRWGLGLVPTGAPFDIFGLSPAPIFIVVGIALVQAFLVWTRRRQAAGKTPLLALQVIESREERAAVYAMFTVVALEGGLNFMVPLYIQIVPGRSPLDTAIAMMPFNLTVFFTAMLIVRLYDSPTPRQIARFAFILMTVALIWLAFVVKNNWETFPVILGLFAFGVGQGALVVGLLSAGIMRALVDYPIISPELQSQVDLDSINFVSNDRLLAIMQRTTATPEQVDEAVRINAEARLRALKIGLFAMAGLALLTLLPAGRLPDYKPGEMPPPDSSPQKL